MKKDMRDIVNIIDQMEGLSVELFNGRLSGKFQGTQLSKFSSVADLDLAEALHYAENACQYIAAVYVRQTKVGEPTRLRDRASRDKATKFRNRMSSYYMQVMRLLYGDAPEICHMSARPFAVNRMGPAEAIAVLVRKALPVIVKYQTRNTESIEHVLLKPIVQLLTKVAWKMTNVSSYRKEFPEERCNFDGVRKHISRYFPEGASPVFRAPLRPKYLPIPKDTADIFSRQFYDIVSEVPQDWEMKYKVGDFVNMGNQIFRTKTAFTLVFTKYHGIVKKGTSEALSVKDIAPAF